MSTTTPYSRTARSNAYGLLKRIGDNPHCQEWGRAEMNRRVLQEQWIEMLLRFGGRLDDMPAQLFANICYQRTGYRPSLWKVYESQHDLEEARYIVKVTPPARRIQTQEEADHFGRGRRYKPQPGQWIQPPCVIIAAGDLALAIKGKLVQWFKGRRKTHGTFRAKAARWDEIRAMAEKSENFRKFFSSRGAQQYSPLQRSNRVIDIGKGPAEVSCTPMECACDPTGPCQNLPSPRSN